MFLYSSFKIVPFSLSASLAENWTKEYGRYIPGVYVMLHSFGSEIKFNSHFHVSMAEFVNNALKNMNILMVLVYMQNAYICLINEPKHNEHKENSRNI